MRAECVPASMKAALLYGKQDIRIQRLSLPKPGRGEALVAVRAVGICGSDLRYYQEFGMSKDYQLTQPQILGHEASGVVVALGQQTEGITVGTRVAIEPGETCFACPQCKSGHYNLCSKVRFLSTPGNKGAFAEYLVMPASLLFPIPDSLSYSTACLAEPLSVGLHACRLAGIGLGKKVLVLGAGPVGLLALVAARANGANQIMVCDVYPGRLAAAKRLCATSIVNVSEVDFEARIDQFTSGMGFDCCIETAGSPETCRLAVDFACKGASIALVGVPDCEVPMDLFRIVDRQISLHGVFRYANCYPEAIKILTEKNKDCSQLITRCFPLEQTGLALKTALEDKANSIKTVVTNEQ